MSRMRIPGMEPKRRNIETTGTHVTVGVTPPDFMALPEQQVQLTTDQYARYLRWLEGGDLIQKLLPDLTDDVREILMTGLGDADFHRITKDPDE
jgi:hypothetical protein